MSHYKHLTIEERESLYLLKGQGYSVRRIAAALGRSASTVSRELGRNKRSHRPYSPSAAQRRYVQQRKRCGRKRILVDTWKREQIRHYIQDLHWSPEEIEHRLCLEDSPFQISCTTIYRAISAGLYDPKQKYVRKDGRFSRFLRRKGKKRRKNGHENKQGKYQIEHTISQRPAEAEQRLEPGHFEADTVSGKHGSGCILTLVDRYSRFLLARRLPCAEAVAVQTAMVELLGALPPEKRKTVTPDRGREFARYQAVEQALTGITFYFADPHAPWQRGTNENTNGLLREMFPKYSDFSAFSDAFLDDFVFLMNFRPRKCLDWRAPFEIFFGSLLHLT